MGAYDYLPRGSQLKCWECAFRSIEVGDRVPILDKNGYIVLLREGGYVKVDPDGTVAKIVENYGRKLYVPEDFPGIVCFDKWGTPVNSKKELIGAFMGLMGMNDTYYFKEGKSDMT